MITRPLILIVCLIVCSMLQPDWLSLSPNLMRFVSRADSNANQLEARANGRILFVSNRDGPGSEIYLMDPDGSSQVNLTNNPGEDFSPDWSPQGTKIVFVSYRAGGGHQKLFTMTADGTNPVQLTTGTSDEAWPDWSPDGSKIVFFSHEIGSGGIYVINADGTNLTRLTNNRNDNVPVWSPDGTRIAFARFSPGISDIYVMNADGSNPLNLTNDPTGSTNPAWSPDGSKILFSSRRDSLASEIYVMDSNGANPKRLTYNSFIDGFPSWSPDGTRIVFNRDAGAGANSDIFVMNADGSNEIQLTSHPAHDSDANWQPLPANVNGYLEFTAPAYHVIENIALATITLKRVGGSSGMITVDYATSDGSAIAGVDYTPSSGTVTFADGELTKTFTVLVLNDSVTESEETVNLTLSNPTGGSGLGLVSRSVLRITDSSVLPVLSVGGANTGEGNAGLIDINVTVQLSAATGNTVTVEFSTFSMTATSGEDFEPTNGALTFAPGETVKTVMVKVIGDVLDEDDEFFRVGLGNATNAAISVSSNPPLIKIFDDDILPDLSINDVTVTEGNSGTTNAVFTVTLAPASGRTIQVNYSTSPGSASHPNDYQFTSGTITFVPGQTTGSITVPVIGETVFETNETFDVILTSASNANIPDFRGTCSILDDDSPPTISIDDVSLTEGDNGTINAVFVVRLSAASSAQVGYSFTTVAGTATQNVDYGWVSGGDFFFPGTTVRAIQVPIIGDRLDEPDETFSVVIANPTNGSTIVKSIGVGSILDNDPPPTVSINDVIVDEGNSGTTNAVFLLNLSSPSGKTINLDYSTANGSATAGIDYVASSRTVTFSPGETTKQISITVNGDTLGEAEADENFLVNLSNPVNVTFQDSQGSGTILNYVTPSVRFAAARFSTMEGSGNPAISILRAGSLVGSVSVDFSIADGSAKQTTDYTVMSGTLTFAQGETLKLFRIPISDDLYVEAEETVNLILSNPAGGNLAVPNTATLDITDNDSATPTTNPLDGPDAYFFVNQHYYDFLGREPDAGGLAYWSNQISSCGMDPSCVHARRIAVSDAFFFEPEFQKTGGYVFRIYRAAYGNNQPFPNPDTRNPSESLKLPSYATFVQDRARVLGGAQLTQSQVALATAFVQRPDFLARYPASLTGEQFVDAILATVQSTSGADLSTERNALVDLVNQQGRQAVLYRLADDDEQNNPINNRPFIDAEYRRTFVFTEYVGYLRRDADIEGFLFWLGQVNRFPLRDAQIQHVMACAFITSAEYQRRFSPVVTHTNQECGP